MKILKSRVLPESSEGVRGEVEGGALGVLEQVKERGRV